MDTRNQACGRFQRLFFGHALPEIAWKGPDAELVSRIPKPLHLISSFVFI